MYVVMWKINVKINYTNVIGIYVSLEFKVLLAFCTMDRKKTYPIQNTKYMSISMTSKLLFIY